MPRKERIFSPTSFVRLIWRRCTSGYERIDRTHRARAGGTILDDLDWDLVDIVSRGDAFREVKVQLPANELYVDFLNAASVDDMLAFVSKWGLPTQKIQHNSVDLNMLMDNREKFRDYQVLAEMFQKCRDKCYREGVLAAFSEKEIGDIGAALDLGKTGTPTVSLTAKNPWHFMRLSLFHSAFVEPIAVMCDADCGRFVRLTPLGRTNSVCSDACRQKLARKRKQLK